MQSFKLLHYPAGRVADYTGEPSESGDNQADCCMPIRCGLPHAATQAPADCASQGRSSPLAYRYTPGVHARVRSTQEESTAWKNLKRTLYAQ